MEVLGSWDPHHKKGVFNGDKIKYWISKGAQVSDSVWNLLIRQGIIEGRKRAVKIKKTEKTQKETESTRKKAEEAAKEEIKTEETKPEEKTKETKPEESKKE